MSFKYCFLKSLVLLCILIFKSADCVAVVKVKFVEYRNEKGLGHNGNTCDPIFYASQRHCDPYFTIDITVGGVRFHAKTERAKDKNTVRFYNKIINIDNPIVIQAKNYKGVVELTVRVDDYDPVGAHDLIGEFRYSYLAPARPFGDSSSPHELKLVDNGQSSSVLVLQISVQCEVHYYGRECDRFCQPKSSNRNGHYVCLSNGSIFCEPEFDPATNCTEKFCSSQPCKNGGVCFNQLGRFYCECQGMYGGAKCTDLLAPCQNHKPCRNGGTCLGTGCACHAGFHGDACEQDVDECISSPCVGNGSVCENWVGTFTCRCGAGWRGRVCGEDIDECANELAEAGSSACENNGTCENTRGSFICHCPLGFRGQWCQEDVNECETGSGLCLNETELCQNLWGGFACVSRSKFDDPNGPSVLSPKSAILSGGIPWWTTVLAVAVIVPAIVGLVLVKPKSFCSLRCALRKSSSSTSDGREKTTADNATYQMDVSEVNLAGDGIDVSLYDVPLENVLSSEQAESDGPNPLQPQPLLQQPPRLPPRSLDESTIDLQYLAMVQVRRDAASTADGYVGPGIQCSD